MNSFTWRLTLWFSTLVTVTTAALLLVGGWLLQRQLLSSIDRLHAIEGEELTRLLGGTADLTTGQVAHLIQAEADSDAALFFIQIHNDLGKIFFRSGNLGETILPSPLIEQSYWNAEVQGLGAVRVSDFRSGPWHVQIASPLSPVWRALRDYARVSVFLVGFSAAAGIGLGYGFSRYTLRPVRTIESTARLIRPDNLSQRIEVPPGNDEIAALARLLNELFDRIESAFAQVRQFTANASHEIKTPLALIRLSADKLRIRVASDPEAVRTVDDLNEEVTRLHQIMESLLFLSKADGGVLALNRETIPMCDWLTSFAEDARALAEDRGSRFELARCDSGSLQAEPHLLRHLLLNLLTNALSAAPPDSRVTLDSIGGGGDWTFIVTDEGPGLAPEELDRVFERFVRLRPKTSGLEDGHGLGLAICRSIAQLHGGTIRAENRTDRNGLRVIVHLPVAVQVSTSR